MAITEPMCQEGPIFNPPKPTPHHSRGDKNRMTVGIEPWGQTSMVPLTINPIYTLYTYPKDPFVCPKSPGFPLQSYSEDGIHTINPTLGRGLDS